MSPDAVIGRLASEQAGNVTFGQLRRAGLSRGEIATRVRRGTLIRRHRSVYAVGHVPQEWFSRAFAAWLAHGRTSALSHTACTGAFAVLDEPVGPIHVTRPTEGASVAGTVLHHAYLSGDVWEGRGLVLTSPARLMLDLAATQPFGVLERAYNEAQVKGLLTPAQLQDRLDGWSGRRGVRALRELVLDAAVTRSVLEDAFKALLRTAGLPWPEMNEWVDGAFVDAVWRDRRVVVELDGRAVHEHKGFEGDRAKGNRLALAGWVVLRFTYRRIRRQPLQVVAELVRALEGRR